LFLRFFRLVVVAELGKFVNNKEQHMSKYYKDQSPQAEKKPGFRFPTAYTVFLILLILVVAGCTQSLEEAQVEFCQALDAYGEAVQELQNVSASTTVDELQSARDNVADALEDVTSAGGNLREARLRTAENAWDNTQEAINDISGDATLGEAAATIRGQAVILATEIDRIASLTCGRR
jgi:hypothetical protein